MAHQCSICLKMFKCASKLQRHHLIHSGEKPFICSVCGRAFRQAIHLKRHIETHTGSTHTLNPFTSSWGQFESDGRVEPAYAAYPTVQDNLGIDYTPDVPLQPSVSSEVDELKQTGDYVVDLKGIEQPEFKLISPDGVINTDWECLSGKDLTQQILQEHQVSSSRVEDATSNTDNVLQCAVCLKFCSSPYQLQKHLLVHSRQKPFECAICKQTFSQMAHLKLHSQTHAQADFPQDVTEVRSSPAAEIPQCSTSKGKTKGSHQCPECPKSFCSPYKLRRHCLTHTGQRPFHCIECGKSFRQLAHLKTHQETHRTVLSIQTPLCEKTTAYPQGSRLNDGNADKCQLPDSELPSFSSSLSLSLQGHKPLDSHRLFNAGVSSNSTFTQRSLQMELQQEMSAPVSQDINEWNSEEGQIPVKNQFDEGNIKRHSIHEKLKPFHCLICGQTFCQAANFQNHLCKDPDQDEFANHGEDIENESSPSVPPHQERTEHRDSDHKMTLQTEEVNALDLNIIVKQEHWPSSNNEEHVPAPDGIEYTTECQLQPALDNTKTKHCELTRKNHQCVTCLKCFPSPYKLQRHILIHTGQRPFGCRVCGKTFRQLAHLMLHNRTHSRPEHIKLKITNVNGHPPPSQIGYGSVSSGSGLQFDVPMQESVPEYHGSEEPLLTSTDLDVPSKSVLDQDRVIHEKFLDGEKNVGHIKHQCSLCFKCFSCPSKLQRHHLIHTGQKPFRCTLCGKTFRQAIHLKVHLQTHNKWRPFRRASQHKWGVNTGESNASRQQHQSTESCYQEQLPTEPQGDLPTSDCQETEEKESGPKSATCERDSGDFTMHFESNTSVKSEDWHSNNNGDLQSMGGSEGVTSIEQCDLQPTSNDSVNECQKVKRKIYQCVTCLKCFLTPYKLQIHVLSHTGQRPFSCHLCGKKFRQLAHMKFHICPCKQPRFSQQRENNENSDLFSLQQVEFHSVSSETTLESDLTPQKTLQSLEHLEISLGPSTSSEKGLDQNNVLATERNKSSGKHQCLICLKYFSCPSKLQRHLLIHTGQKPFRCVLCGKTFRQAIHLKVHQQTHNKWRAMKSASRQDELVNTDIPYGSGKRLNRPSIDQGQCIFGSIPESDVLMSDYSHQGKMEEKDTHIDHKIRTPEPRGVSTLAVKFDQDTLKESEDLCHSNDDLQSTDEGKKSIQKYQLQPESLNDVKKCQTLKSKTYNCVTCLKCFSTPSKLQRHILSHTGQRPFSCYVCGKKFRQIAHMKFHIRTHNQPRITLQKKNNEDSDPFILHHVEYDKVSAVESDLSPQHFDQNLEEEKRLDTNSNQSSPSERGTDQSNHLSSGSNRSHGKHQCSICFKCFSCPSKLQRHLLTHTGQKPFRCVLCGKTFRQAIHLKVHQQTHNKWRSLKRASRQDVLDNTYTSNGDGHHLSWSSSFQGQCILTSAPQSDVITSESSHQETMEDPDVDCKMNSPEPGPVNALAVQFDQDTVAVPVDLYPSTDDYASMPHETTVLTKQLQLVSKENVNACQGLKRKANQCVVCLKCFSSPSKLQRHILTHTGQRPFSCYVCGRKFRQLSHMKFHILTHNRPKITQQKNNFVNSVTFSLHKNLIDSVPSGTTLDSDIPLQQNTPEKGTDEPLKLGLNLAPSEAVLDQDTGFYYGSSHGNVKHQCLICSKCFTCPSKLKRHNLIHTGQRPYRCVLCGKTFRQAIHLKIHQQTHNKWRSLKRASRQDVLDNTYTSNGDGNHLSWSSSFQGQCVLTSAPQSDVITSDSSHQETVEDPDVDCKMNSPEPGPVNDLVGQFDQDTFAVPVDLHPSTDDSASMPHETTVLTKQLQLVSKENVNACQGLKKKANQCVVCLKCFSSPSKLQRHILTHTGQRPFSCYVCGKKFRQLSHMKFHILTHNRPKITQQKNNFVNSVTFSLYKNLLDSVPSGTTLDSDIPLQQNTPEKGTDEPLKLGLNLAPSEAVLAHDSGVYNGRNHSNVKHQCLICSKCFTCPSKLKRHNLIHTGQRPYRCVLCGKTFRQAIHLKIHQQTHNKWRTFRRAAQKQEVHASRPREQDKAQCIITSVPQTSSLLKAGLNQLSGKEVVDDDDVCAGRVMLDEQENQIDTEINAEAFQDSQCSSASSQLKSSNLAHLHPTPFKCNICYRNFKQLSHLKAHYLIHLETHPVENPFPMKNVPCQKQMNYGLEEEDQKVNSAMNRPAYACSTHPQNSTLEAGVLSPNKSNAHDQTSQESSDTEGKNTPRGKGDSEWSTLSLNASLQDRTSTVPTTQEDEQNWDRFSEADQEESDCVIIESNDAGVESPVTLWHANGNSEISHSIKKGYQCPVCSKCFPLSSQLQQHALVHAENKPSKCPFCFKEFMPQSLLNSHLCTHEDWRDSGHCNLSNTRQPEEQDGQELPACDQSSHFITAEPVMDSWHPAAPDYSSGNVNSVDKDMSSLTGFTSTGTEKLTRTAYQCTVCLKNFETPYKLSRHFLIHTDVKPFKCSVCNKSFRQLCHLQSHQQTHRGNIFRDVQPMDNGQRFDHTEDYAPQSLPSEGHFSTAQFPQEAKLRDSLHLSDCTSYPLKPSTHRNLTSSDSSDHLAENMASGSVGILHVIPDAELELDVKRRKRDHKCSECQKSFSSPSKLERHYLIHAEERPFKCSICDKAFRQAAHLKVHQRVHAKISEDRSSFSSEIIDSGFNRHNSSHSHAMKDISETHINYGMRKDIGEGQESQVAGVEVALESEHCAEYWCEPLDGLFNCEDCNESFVTERRLNMHRCSSKSIASGTESSFYQCAICFKNFKSPYKLKRHYVIHTGERPFRCSVCKKTFTQSGHLKTHELCHK